MMPIAPLPQEAVRLLRAHVVISSPVSVVKELLENSIDAKATAIEVLVTRNMVDRIEVRDNGIGIETKDFEALGRRGHTSKLKSAEELENIGGTSLGFRGEAIAALAAVARVTVTTRTAADDTATVFELHMNGKGSLKNTVKSTPVGTTVTVSEMFGRLPVRQNVAIKKAKSIMAKMKQLLMAYALARPLLKLSIKEIGMALPYLSYSPRPDGGMKQAVVSLFGFDLGSHCIEVTYKTQALTRHPGLSKSPSKKLSDEFVTEIEICAILPAQDTTPAKISNKGAFFSVDSRPVSASRNVFKKIYGRFKKCVAKSLEASNDGKQIKEPFIALNINCPRGSYDVNLEPAKDDILFTSQQCIVDACDALFEQTYKPLDVPYRTERCLEKGTCNSFGLQERHSVNANANKDMSGEARDAVFSPSATQPAGDYFQASDPFSPIEHNSNLCKQAKTADEYHWSVNMAGGDSSDDEVSLPAQNQLCKPSSGKNGPCAIFDSTLPTSPQQEDETSRLLDGVNPWMLAKMNTAIRKANGVNSEHPDVHSSTGLVLPQTQSYRHQDMSHELVPGQALWNRTTASNLTISSPRFHAVKDLELSNFGQSYRTHQQSWVSPETPLELSVRPESNYQTPPSSSEAEKRSRGQKREKRVATTQSGRPQSTQSKLFSRSGWGSSRRKGNIGALFPSLPSPWPNGSGELRSNPVLELQARQSLRLLSPPPNFSQDQAPTGLEAVRERTTLIQCSKQSSPATLTNPFYSLISSGSSVQPEIITARALLQCEVSSDDNDPKHNEDTSNNNVRNERRSKSQGHSSRQRSVVLLLETATKDTLGLEIWEDNFDHQLFLAVQDRLSIVDDYLITGKIQEGLLIDYKNLCVVEEQLKSVLHNNQVDQSGQGYTCEVNLRRAMAEKTF